MTDIFTTLFVHSRPRSRDKNGFLLSSQQHDKNQARQFAGTDCG
ncbi:MAG: hypothetical protein ACPK85_09645 [Methanosarcina sp.]